MSCSSNIGPTQRHLVATTTGLQYEWFSAWELCNGASALKAVIKRRQSTAFQAQLAIQLAAVRTDMPDAPIAIGNLAAGDGETCSGIVNITSDTVDKFWIRTGVAYSATSATLGQSDVTFQASLARCGRLLTNQTVTLSTYTTTNGYHVLTGWFSALDVEIIKAAIVCTGLIGNFRCRLAYRTANTSPEVPNAWSTTLGTVISADGETPEPDTTLANMSGVMWVQLGIQYYLSTGSALGQATVSVALAGRR
jgi:hypothetical protein